MKQRDESSYVFFDLRPYSHQREILEDLRLEREEYGSYKNLVVAATGKGKSGLSWTVGAQGVEIEYNPKIHTYRLLRAITVADVGKVINPKMAQGVVMGGMNMGLGLATREGFVYDENAILQNTSLRTYKLMHFGEQPKYIVEFIETPQKDGPFGARGIGEHGILGIPAAFGHAVQVATGKEFNGIPISPESIWKTVRGGENDRI